MAASSEDARLTRAEVDIILKYLKYEVESKMSNITGIKINMIELICSKLSSSQLKLANQYVAARFVTSC